jgi:predicted RNA-binding Zn ribbon-like protein
MKRDIELLLALLETYYDAGAFANPESIAAWLIEHGLLTEGERPADEELRRVPRLRAAMLDYLRGGDELDARTIPSIEAASAAGGLRVTVGPAGEPKLVAGGSGVDRALGELATALYRASSEGELVRLKMCKACGYPFYDVTKNRSRVWCEMASCGSQHKAKEYRKRQKAAEQAQAGT